MFTEVIFRNAFTTMAVCLSRSYVCNAALHVLPSLRPGVSVSFRQASAVTLSSLGSAVCRAPRANESRFLSTIASADDGATAVSTVEEPAKSADDQKPSLTPEGELQCFWHVNALAQTRPASVFEPMARIREKSPIPRSCSAYCHENGRMCPKKPPC